MERGLRGLAIGFAARVAEVSESMLAVFLFANLLTGARNRRNPVPIQSWRSACKRRW